ncbi:hypothetical protein [Granulicella arctica]|uniref:hypothetical protein n=1 Tax=Granulicella arctica TaxID=940613 RepID=UPI0021E05F37|nr:hypothetical protein [Granulicella arctica]
MQKFSRLNVTTFLVLATASVCSYAAAAPTSGPTSTVVYVGGNDVVLKAADGKLLNFTVPAGYHFSARGKELTVAELKPGTALIKPVATGTDPKMVSGVSVIKAKVYGTAPPDGVTLSLADGTKDFTVPAGTTFTVGGKPMSIAELKPDMMVEATVITTVGEATADAAADAVAPNTPPMTGALLVAKSAAEAELPLAGTNLPLFGMMGFVLLALGIGLVTFKKPVGQV